MFEILNRAEYAASSGLRTLDLFRRTSRRIGGCGMKREPEPMNLRDEGASVIEPNQRAGDSLIRSFV